MIEKIKKILVVDDDPSVLTLLDHVLRTSGFGVITAHDGVDALERVNEGQPSIDIAVIDVMMPRMNGAQLAEKLLSFFPGIRIIFISGYAPDTISYAVHGQNRPFLEKPFDLAVFLKTVRRELATLGS